MKTIIIVIAIFSFISCEHRLDCSHETTLFKEQWSEKIKKVYKDPNQKATYIIETYSGRQIVISPAQSIVYLAADGDSLIKKPYRFEAELRTVARDTFNCVLTSSTCDNAVLKEVGMTRQQYIDRMDQ